MRRMSFIFICLGLLLKQYQGCTITAEGLTWQFNESTDKIIPGLTSIDQCKEACAASYDCSGYTWEPDDIINLCFHFETTQITQECENCQSGTIPFEESFYGCVVEGDHVVALSLTNTTEECLEACVSSSNCTEYLYFTDRAILKNWCVLYSGCPGKQECQHCRSGQLTCITDSSLPDQCTSYQVLGDHTRSVHHDNSPGYCDGPGYETSPDWKGSGWYRFQSPAGEMLAGADPGFRRCGTGATGWTKDEHPSIPGDTGTLEVCFSGGINDCGTSVQVEVTNCGSYYVYHLEDVPHCYLRYCATEMDNI